MTNRVEGREVVTTVAEQVGTSVVPTRHAPTKPLEEVVDAIRTDSLTDASSYLEETKVPHGGE